MSRMQQILERARQCHFDGMQDDAFNAIIEALEMLSRGQQQVMRDIGKVHQNFDDIPIGGGDKET